MSWITRPYGWAMKQLRRAYDWVVGWAHTPYGTPALFGISFLESSVFPIPPDPLLMALCLGRRARSLFYAFICTLSSVLGGMLGYLIGLKLMAWVGWKIVHFYNAEALFHRIGGYYEQHAFLFVFIAGFFILPYKIFTIAAGAFQISFWPFVLASILGRGGRFFAVAALLKRYGEPLQRLIDRYFHRLALLFLALVAIGFVLIKRLFH